MYVLWGAGRGLGFCCQHLADLSLPFRFPMLLCFSSPSLSSPAWWSFHHLDPRVARQERDAANQAPAPKDFQQEVMCHFQSHLIGQSKSQNCPIQELKDTYSSLVPRRRGIRNSDGNQRIATDKSPQRDGFVLAGRRFVKLVLLKLNNIWYSEAQLIEEDSTTFTSRPLWACE